MSMREPTLQRIVDRGLCAGCGACAAVTGPGAVRMRIADDGWARPQALRELSAQEQGAIASVCPGLRLAHERMPEGTVYDPAWGPLRSVHTGHATDPEVRFAGSSGGVLSALLIHLLESGTVDAVVHVGADPAQPLRNKTLISTSRAQVLAGAGSRYAPAAPVEALPEALSRHGRVAFVGKPCDVAAVRQWIRAEPALAARVPLLLSFMCAGTPSEKGTHGVLQRLGVPAEQVVAFRFRGEGWPGLTTAVTRDGERHSMDYNSSWGQILNRHLQRRCKLCADGTGELADLICADAWYGKDGYPDFTERDGRSLVIARTEVGAGLLTRAVAAGAVAIQGFDVGELPAIQPYQLHRKSALLSRMLAVRWFGGATPTYSGFRLRRSTRRLSFAQLAKEFLGTARRQLKGTL